MESVWDMSKHDAAAEVASPPSRASSPEDRQRKHLGSSWPPKVRLAYAGLCIALLLANYFLAQYDKFILSYFQTPLSRSLDL